jgi:cytochrome d ubiquinol oxidase subunit II
VAAVVTGVVALAGLVVVHEDAPSFFHGLVTRGLPAIVASAVFGLAALFLVRRAHPRELQLLAVVPSGSIVLGWGLAQYPNLLGTAAPLQEQAAPAPTLWALTIVAAAALLLVIPSITLLFVLQQRGSVSAE